MITIEHFVVPISTLAISRLHSTGNRHGENEADKQNRATELRTPLPKQQVSNM